MTPKLLISVENGDWPPAEELELVCEEAVKTATDIARLAMAKDSELSLLFTGDEAIRAINREWRGKDAATNVLSFPGTDVAPGEPGGVILGDIVIAFETVTSEAELEGKPFRHHLTHLIVHGFLHLFGYDHMNDDEARIMEGLETRILQGLAIPDPYDT